MSAAVQTLWAELIAATLADAGVTTCVVSPGSRSTPLVAALAADGRFDLPTIIDERAAAFFALGLARAQKGSDPFSPVAMVCTSGSAAAHYLPALVEASMAGVPLIAITADRPPELQDCGASQTIDQIGLYGSFVRAAIDLGPPTGSALTMHALRRKVLQAVTTALGPRPGPVQLEVPLRKPLEPAAPSTDEERALAKAVAELRRTPVMVAPPRMLADDAAIAALADAISREPKGVIVAGAMPASFARARDAVFALAARAGYPILAEAGSQLRFAPRPAIATTIGATTAAIGPTTATTATTGIAGATSRDAAIAATTGIAGAASRDAAIAATTAIAGAASRDAAMAAPVFVDHFDLVLASKTLAPEPKLVIQIGAEPVGAAWPMAFAGAQRWVLADRDWHDADSSAHAMIVGDVASTFAALVERVSPTSRNGVGPHFASAWQAAEARAAGAVNRALASHPRSEGAVLRAVMDALPATVALQIGNSLPIRVIDQVCSSTTDRRVLTQRGAAGIDGLIASAAGATCAGAPVLLVLGDVSFAHDIGGLLAAREARAPLAILVLDNGGGRIFDGLPFAKTNPGSAFARHWTTTPGLDPAAVALVLGAQAVTAASPSAAAAAVAAAFAKPGVTVIHAPVTPTGAHDVRRDVLELVNTSSGRASSGSIAVVGAPNG